MSGDAGLEQGTGESLVFVYGTLRRGEPAHHLIADTTCVAEAHTPPHYTMVSLGEYPALVEGGRTAIVGEVYRVDRVRLAMLDDYEEAPAFYRRVTIEVAGLQVQLYVLPAQHAQDAPIIPSGDWRLSR